ncbi:MAG TPA: hypothetical protein VJU53_01720 [Burkholderiaceae bacterium]|nr:hypothetical protein [Burkholderiaceae bacterium]
MSLYIGHVRVGKQAIDNVHDRVASCKISINHQVVYVERAQRQLPRAHRLRNFVDAVVRGFGTLAHKDRMARVVRITRRLMNVVNQKKGLARLGVTQLDAVRIAGLRVSDTALGSMLRKFFVGQTKQNPEWL